LDDAINKTNAQLAKFEPEAIAKAIRELQAELEQLPQQIDDATRSIIEVQGEIARLEAEKQALQQRFAHAPGQLREIEMREDGCRKNLDDLKNIIADLEARRAAILEQIAQLEKQKKGLANREKMLGVLKNIIEDESWDDLVSTFTLVSSLEKQASSLVDELEVGDNYR
jgi:chromosome segregation ATPase